MKRDRISEVNYIDILIAREQQIASSGQQNKLAVLHDLRNQYNHGYTEREYDPFRINRERAKQIYEGNPGIRVLDMWINVSNNIKQHATK